MFGLGLDNEKLAAYAARLGSDCAFFVWNRPMFGEGRGEVLAPFDMPVKIIEPGEENGAGSGIVYELKIIVPEGIAVSTAEAYRGIKPAVPAVRLKDVLSRPVSEWKELLVNDFEKTVFGAHPELAAMHRMRNAAG